MNRNPGLYFNRELFIRQIEAADQWDVLVIGGGATGLGIAVDAASRGFKTLLLEQSDFAKGTSSRSTKLVHGGVRYLAQGDVGLVYEALRERGRLLKNAPHLVKPQAFIIPCYSRLSCLFYLAGLKLYDWLSGSFSFGKSTYLSSRKVKQLIPGLKSEGLAGGIQYFDGQFDDARLAVNLAQTCAENGGTLLNYFQAKGLIKKEGKVEGVKAADLETGREYRLRAKTVINATGVFVDEVLKMDMPEGRATVRPSQGSHVVLDRSFLQSESAIMIPKTSDGRVLFAIPWHQHALIGTTDTPLNENNLEPVALGKEIDFILNTAGQYLTRRPQKSDVLAVFAGLRPLAAPEKDNTESTKEISRSHKLMLSPSGLITITGGKWTTYRKMGEDVVNMAVKIAQLPEVKCRTKNLQIHGAKPLTAGDHLSGYGTDAEKIQALIEEDPELGQKLKEGAPWLKGEVIWAVRNEMARTVEDVLARRLRVLFLDARTAIDMCAEVATLMAGELNLDNDWKISQIRSFTALANQYLLEPYSPLRGD